MEKLTRLLGLDLPQGEPVMPAISQALTDFLSAARLMADIQEPEPWLEGLVRVNQCANVLGACAGADPEEVSRAAAELILVLGVPDPQVGGEAAITLGVFIERGMPPRPVSEALLQAFERTLELLRAFNKRVLQKVPEPSKDEEAEEEGGYWVDDRYVSPQLAREFWRQDRRLPQAHAALEKWYLPVVAVLSRDRDVLQGAQRNTGLVELVNELDISFVRMLLCLLIEETLLVLHPETVKGFRVLIDGVADNFQLHTLLADALVTEGGFLRTKGPKWGLPGKRPSPAVVATMRGDGPQSIAESSTGVWNLYNWTALDNEGRLPVGMNTKHWIWNEGIPADILPFEGQRIILLGPPEYHRGWNTARPIPALKATVAVQEVLEEPEIHMWMNRLASACRNPP